MLRTGVGMRLMGHACLLASIVCLIPASLGVGGAAVDVVRLHWPASPLLLLVADPAATASPSPPAAIAAAGTTGSVARRRSFIGRGPIAVRANGTFNLGVARQTRSGAATVGSDTLGSSFSLALERRTEQSAITLTDAVGYSNGATTVGQLALGYKTPLYALSYGLLLSSGDSQLGVAGFARGVSLVIPRRKGTATLLASTTGLQDGTTLRVGGVRVERYTGGGILAASAFAGVGESDPARVGLFDLSYRGFGKITTQTEAALAIGRGMPGIGDGSRYGVSTRLDEAFPKGIVSISARTIPHGFPALGSVIQPTSDMHVTLRRDLLGGSLGLDLADEASHDLTGPSGSIARRATATLATHLGGVNASLLAGVSSIVSQARSLDRTLALQTSEIVGGFSLSQTAQLAATSGDGGVAQQRQLGFSVSRRLLGGFASFQLTRSTASSGGESGATTYSTVSYQRPLGRKTTVAVSQSITSAANGGILLTQGISQLDVTRRLGPVISLHFNAARTTQSGPGGGTGTSFQLNLNGPLGLGGGSTTGRANPRLPAEIRGIVSLAADAVVGVGPARGAANLLIVLDNRYVQRTDATGEFDFRQVAPGQHTVAIEPTTLPPGIVADRESQGITVQGGQTATVAFAVGNFAGVRGFVARMVDGHRVGVGGVGIMVDGGSAAQTSADGRFAIGRLASGQHVIKLIDNTVPSELQFLDNARTISVTNGLVTPVEFVAVSLGRIAGRVLIAPDGGFGEPQGLKDAYVVANPGDHAAITDDSGGFVLDNLPPGTYTLTVDNDTIPPGNDVLAGPDGPVTLAPGASVGGVAFRIGPAAKDVVMTFSNGRKTPVAIAFDLPAAPPGALVRITVTPQHGSTLDDPAVESDVFGRFPLARAAGAAWTAQFLVPPLAKGNYQLAVTSQKTKIADGEALLAVDPGVALITTRFDHAAARPGKTVRVLARILAPFEEGDLLRFDDGYTIKVPRPRGRVVSFDVRIGTKGLPYNGVLVDQRKRSTAFSLR